jgi:hypothetical protein
MPTTKFYQSTFLEDRDPWERAHDGMVHARKMMEKGEHHSGPGHAVQKRAEGAGSLTNMIQTVRKVREVVDLHEEYATGGIQSLEKKKLEEEGEAEAQVRVVEGRGG